MRDTWVVDLYDEAFDAPTRRRAIAGARSVLRQRRDQQCVTLRSPGNKSALSVHRGKGRKTTVKRGACKSYFR